MTRTTAAAPTRRIVILALPGAFSLDVLGTFEIFVAASRLLALRSERGEFDPHAVLLSELQDSAYAVELVSVRAGPLDTFGGSILCATGAIADVSGPVDTFVVAGGDVIRMLQTLEDEPAVKSAIQRVAKGARRIASVCTGSFVLAELGLLEGRRATSHWAACDLLQARHPRVLVDREPIYTQDGNVYTSAGATTGMDLTLALVRDDHGSEIAREIARWLVLYVVRSSSQSQLSVWMKTDAADRKPLRELQHWITENLSRDLSVTALAAQVGMSVRNFARAFKRELSLTPAAYVEKLRVEAARRKLELGAGSLAEVAFEVGFGSVDTMRRAFVRETGRPPSMCREELTRKREPAERMLRLVGDQ